MIIDVVVVLVLIVSLIVGYQRGVIQPLLAEIFFFGTLLAVFRFHDQYTTEMQKLLHLNAVLAVFVALIIAVVMGAIGGSIGGAFHRLESIRGIDGLLGVEPALPSHSLDQQAGVLIRQNTHQAAPTPG